MKEKDIPIFRNIKYTNQCDQCDGIQTVFTQKDEHPEYYTEVYIPCQFCGNIIKFELPVN